MADIHSTTFLAPTPSHTTNLYRQNVSNFLFCSAALLEQQLPEHDVTDNSSKNGSSLALSWIGDTARSLALRSATPLVGDDDAGEAAPQKDNKNRRKKRRSSTASKNGEISAGDIIKTLPPTNNWSDFICMSCGTFLFPPMPPTTNNPVENAIDEGNTDKADPTNITSAASSLPSSNRIVTSSLLLPSNIYTRPLKRGRTRRRRASRTKAKQLQNRALSHQRRGSSTSNNTHMVKIRNLSMKKERMEEVASSYRLGDGCAKNCLIMKCTFCGVKRRRKGLGIDKKANNVGTGDINKKERNSGEGEKGKVCRIKMVDRRSNASQRKKAERISTNVTSQIHDNSDYISLGSIGSGGGGGRGNRKDGHGAHPMKRAQVKSSDSFANSPLLEGGKKKKKKKKSMETKKGGLDDFLSSLND